MELDRALELAVVSSWEKLVAPNESCSIHVVYENVPDLAMNSVEVWKVKNRGYEGLVCRYSIPRSDSSIPRLNFANSYHSKTLADNLDFIMRNQCQFSRPTDHSIHGLVQIDCPTEEHRKSAIAWSCSVHRDFADTRVNALSGDTGSDPENLFSKEKKTVMSDTNKVTPTKEEIRRRAHELYEVRGRHAGQDVEDWIAAERELTEQGDAAAQKTRAAKAS